MSRAKRILTSFFIAIPFCVSPMIATAQTREELHDSCVGNCWAWVDIDTGQYGRCVQMCEDQYGYGEPAPRGDPNRIDRPKPGRDCVAHSIEGCDSNFENYR